MYWNKPDGEKPCIRVEIKGSEVCKCGEDWEVQSCYFDEMDTDLDWITVTFTKKGKKSSEISMS